MTHDNDIPPLRDYEGPDGEEHVERVWERLERNLALYPRKQKRARARFMLAAAMAAGVTLGLGIGEWMHDKPSEPGIAVAPAVDRSTVQVFAAGTAPRSYSLPGGGTLDLTPGSIVDTVDLQGEQLTLRLVRGEVTCNSGGGRIAMQVGQAEVATAAGAMIIRLDGSNADLEVLSGTAQVTSPHQDGPRRTTLAAHERATVAVRVLTASVPAPMPVDDDQGPQPGPWPAPDKSAPDTPDWSGACDNGRYEAALDALVSQYGSLDAAISKVPNASALMCITTGLEWRNVDHDSPEASAGDMTAAYQRILEEFPDDVDNGALAARGLSKSHKKAGNDEDARKFAALANQLTNGDFLPSDALCKKIQSDATAGSDEAVLRLSQRYRTQFPNGRCSNTIDGLVAAIEARKAAARESEAPAERDDKETSAGETGGQGGSHAKDAKADESPGT